MPATYPEAEWLHHIDFPDAPLSDAGPDTIPPIHVCQAPVKFNGVRTDARIMRGPITVTGGHHDDGMADATVVSFLVDAASIEWGPDPEHPYHGVKIGGLLILSPKDVEWPVEVTKADRPRQVHQHYPDDQTVEIRRVHVFARTVAFTAG